MMKKIVVLLIMATIPMLATASEITYYTIGEFNGSPEPANLTTCATAACTSSLPLSGGGSLVFTGMSSTTNPLVPDDPNDGFATDVAPLGTFTNDAKVTSTLINDTFTLFVYQTEPGPESGQLLGSLSGTLVDNGGKVEWYFTSSDPTLIAGGPDSIIWQLVTDNLCPKAHSNCVLMGSGTTDLSASVTAPSPVPEPSSMVLMSLGLSSIGLFIAAGSRQRKDRARALGAGRNNLPPAF